MPENTIGRDLGSLVEEFFIQRGAVCEKAAAACVASLARGGKILAFGNGGSAAEAQHFVAELVNKFLRPRRALRAIALSTDTSVLTSIGNDVSFDSVFSRQIEALGEGGDVALALSTSGNSPNVLNALREAHARGMTTIALTGRGGGRLAEIADFLLDVPSTDTPRIQEVHLVIIHFLAEAIEKKFIEEAI